MPKLKAPTEVVCEPVYPNAGVMAAYYQRLLKPLADMNVELRVLLREYATPLLATDAKPRSPVAKLQKQMDKFAERWTKRWDGMADRIADKFATEAWTATDNGVAASFKKAGFTVKFKPTKPMLLAFNTRVAYNVGLIKSIPQQYLKDVTSSVWNTTTTGGDQNALFEGIQKAYKVAEKRAALIARDQTNKAKAQFEKTRRLELGITQAEWQHSNGGKTQRPTHVRAGRKRVRFDIAKGWQDPHDGKFKQPGEDINCRCTSRAVIPGIHT
jgi:uncharacterized protein with gpF-like domain